MLAVCLGAALDAAAGPAHPGLIAAYDLPIVLAVTWFCGVASGLAAAIGGLAMAWLFAAASSAALVATSAGGAAVFAIASLQRQHIERLSEDQAKLHALLDAGADAILTTDREGRIHKRHDTLTALTGLAWPDYATQPWTGALHPDDAERMPRLPLVQGTKSHMTEVRIRNPRTNAYRWYRLHAVPLCDPKGAHEGWVCTLRDIHNARLAREQREILVGELRHRLKNLVTVIEALAKSSRRKDEHGTEDYLQRFLGRLHALGAAGDLVLAGDRSSLEAGATIRATLAPFMESSAAEGQNARFTISGPELMLSEETGGSLALAVHELATNALKYGALSRPEGRVTLTWESVPGPGGQRIAFEWREDGGPPPAAPEQAGFGMRVITFAPAREQDGKVTFDYPPEGLICRIAFTRETGWRATPEEA